MTWTKVGTELPDDPRLIEVGRGDRWLHLEALVWSNKHRTDGRISRRALARLTDHVNPERGAAELVRVGMWVETEEGWEVVDFLHDQPSADDVEKTQALARERQRRRRQHQAGDHSLCDPRYCTHGRGSRATQRVTDVGGSRVTGRVTNDPRTDPSEPSRSVGPRDGEEDGGRRADAAPVVKLPPLLGQACSCSGLVKVADGDCLACGGHVDRQVGEGGRGPSRKGSDGMTPAVRSIPPRR